MMAETAFEYFTDEDFATVSTNERKMINRVRSLMEKDVGTSVVLREPDDNGGYLLALVPRSWIRISPPRKCAMTEEQKKKAGERLAERRQKAVLS